MQLREYTAQEAGSAARPGLALDWVCPLPLHVMTPVSLGQPRQAPGVRVWFGWGGGAPQRMAGLRPRPTAGSFGGTKRMAEGAAAPTAGLAAHSQCMQAPPLARRARRGRAEPMSQATAVGAAGAGKQPWQRTRVSPRPEGRVGHRVPPTLSSVGPNSEEWAG